MNAIERQVERIILGCRWLLVVFYGGLGAALVIYAGSFLLKLAKVAATALTADETDMVLAMLGLVDGALVASLVVMVMIAGYENFVGRFVDARGAAGLGWMARLDAGALKLKVAASIVAISSIHLLQVFFNAEHYANDKLLWSTVLHLALVVSAVMVAWLNRLAGSHHGEAEVP